MAVPRSAAQASAAGRLSALFAGNASYIGNAEPEPPGQLDVEQDLTYTENDFVDYAEFPLTLTYGLMRRLDVSATAGAAWASYPTDTGGRTSAFGFDDVYLNSKFKVLDQQRAWASQSLELGVKAPTASAPAGLGTGNPDYDLTWLASKDLADGLTVDVNVGYTWIGNDQTIRLSNQLHSGVATEFQAAKNLGFNAQLLCAAPSDHLQGVEFAATVGLGYWFTKRFSAHAAFTKGIGHSLIGYVGTLGVTWSLGPATAAGSGDGQVD